ncbi:hypothetical protein PO909_019428 [Leuciscus waleckii]
MAEESVRKTSLALHQQVANYKEQVRRIGPEPPQQRQQGQHKDDAPTCGICHKTKFADGCGNLCSYCQTKFCARCGGRVSLRSNNEETWSEERWVDERKVNWALVIGDDAAGHQGVAAHPCWDAQVGTESPQGQPYHAKGST